MAPVPWVTTPPDLIEQIVAVLLGNKYENTFRIRPSKGDGGLDVLVPTTESGHFDDYQVKKFASKLGSNEKRHNIESLEAATKTHNDPDSPFLIDTWYLTLPLNPTREQYKWLDDEVERLKPPFKVEWRDHVFLERLAADYPKVIDYYLHDGKDRLNEQIRNLRDFAKLGESETGATLEPSDVLERLSSLRQALNGEDPHYRYDFEVTEREPILFERPDVLASVTAELSGCYVTFHVYALFPDAVWDRRVPISFNISEAELTDEQLEELNNMVRYGTPMSLPESAVSNINIDLPGGLGLVNGSGSVILGPARSTMDRPTRVVWAIVPPDAAEPLAQLVFEMEVPTRGASGGCRIHGVDTTGVVAASMRFEPPDGESRTVSVSVNIIDPTGKPVRQVLPGLRFLHHFTAPNRLALGPEYGLLNVVDEFVLPDFLQTIPAIAVELVESLEVISRRSEKDISFPSLGELDEEDYTNIISVGRMLRGELVPITWTVITAHMHADVWRENSFSNGVLRTTQGLVFTFLGELYDVGQLNTYLLSARIEADFDAEPDEHGTIPITIVPDKNDQAVTTSRVLAPNEAQTLSVDFQTGSA